MILSFLQIHNLRNIRSARFNLDPHLNLIVGANGSGKTSFLESIYLLGSGHSFRTREISPLVSTDSKELTVFARTQDGQSISIQKSISAPTQVRLNGQPCQSSSELAYFLPCQVFYQDLFQIIDAGPAARRSLLDWGLFHVEHPYHQLLRDYQRALKQRNSLIRQKGAKKEFEPWNQILSELGTKLDSYRLDYFQRLEIEFKSVLSLLADYECSLNYYKGWDRKGTGKSLAVILDENYLNDLHRQFTQYGSHQADIVIATTDFKAKNHLSRGQQKIVLIALKLAQTRLMQKSCVYLFDDLSSELDRNHLERLIAIIAETGGQFLITSINRESLPASIYHFPHVQHELNDT